MLIVNISWNRFKNRFTVSSQRKDCILLFQGNNNSIQRNKTSVLVKNIFFLFFLFQTLREIVQIRSYFWSVFSCIRTEYGKIRTRNNSVFGDFSRSGICDTFDYQNIQPRYSTDLRRMKSRVNHGIGSSLRHKAP